MRGLRSGSLAASGTALAGLAAFGLLTTGCSAGGTGTRDEGPAAPAPLERGVPTPSVSASPPPKSVDAVALLRRDPAVSERVKAGLKPCDKDAYPVDTSYGDLTGSTAHYVVVNVMTCGDAMGVGTYVYREDPADTLTGGYRNVFAAEEPAVYATIDRGELVVTQPVYAKGDSVSYPSSEDVVTYAWTNTKFTERYRVRNSYSRAVGGGGLDEPEPEPESESGSGQTVPSEN
ncbi:hypothetical protein [Streptomyces sp. AcH 505]|uniref:hypothetical protein n=1 Tax=Streptomyces sp. AcH 505 TaxID=352211 RepID=UPI0005A913F5